ncbi:MAG: NADP-dependent isocitrate dehydrogenase, partial [Thermoplasmata archaeon]
KRRGEIDGLKDLVNFAENLEKALIKTIEVDKIMTQDVAKIAEPPVNAVVNSEEFIDAVKKNLEKLLKL